MAPMRTTILVLAAVLCLPATAHAETSPAFEEARDAVLAKKAGQALLVIGVGAMGINDQDDAGFTLLHYAVRSGSLESVTELLRAGANPAIEAKGVGPAINLATTDEIRAALKAAADERRKAAEPAR